MGDANIFEFPLYFLPLETDILSLELEDSFSDLYLVSSIMTIEGKANSSSEEIPQRYSLLPKL